MQLHRQAKFLSGYKYALNLSRGKRQVFAECVHGVHQPFGGQGREHFSADVIDVIVGAIGIFRRQGMSRQTGAAHADR
ncbi:N-formimino-L-glutamate deiminase [compost metagenome]